MVHFFESLKGGGIYGNCVCYGPRGRMNTRLFLSKLMGIARRGVLKEILIKLGQHVNEMMAVAVKKFQNF